MDTFEFLRTVWPDEGLYCIATPQRSSDGKQEWWKHYVFETIEDAASHALKISALMQNTYFCMNTLAQKEVWDPTKKSKTGAPGGMRIRTKENTKECRVFFADLDVGEEDGRFGSRSAALNGLTIFLNQTGLPWPGVSSSGRGLHVFWPLTEALPSAVWEQHATKLLRLAQHYGFRLDPSRVKDRTSVLRVPGTWHLKDPTHPLRVELRVPPVRIPTAEFLTSLDVAFAAAGIAEIAPANLRIEIDMPAHIAALEPNIKLTYEEGPPPTLKTLGKVCAQVRWMLQHPAEVSQPQWYLGLLNTVRFCEDGDKQARAVSKYVRADHGHSADEVEEKLQQLKDGNFGPATCGKMAELCGEDRCKVCPFYGKPTSSPVHFARTYRPPIIHKTPEGVEVEVPPAPRPFSRTKDGVLFTSKTPKGVLVEKVIYPYDLYPFQILDNADKRTKSFMWHATLPLREPINFEIAGPATGDLRMLHEVFVNAGVNVDPDNLPHMRKYVIAYIRELQKRTLDQQQHSHLGWTARYKSFVLPDGVISFSDGCVQTKRALLSPGAQNASDTVCSDGTLEKQVELLRFYNQPQYTHLQFAVVAGLAAPIFYMTGHKGALVNMSGESGASKSTALYSAASFWGDPDRYTINGTNKGFTTLARHTRMAVLSNLPVCVDEITGMDHAEARDMALSVSQFTGRVGCATSGDEKKSALTLKSTVMITTANNSLHEGLSLKSAAGTASSMRVFEITCPKQPKKDKEASDDYLRELRHNYGHVGPVFMEYILANHDSVGKRVIDKMRKLDILGSVEPAERFWSALAASVLVAAEIAEEIGLLAFSPLVLQDWIMNEQLPMMRGAVKSNYSNALDVLMEYIEHVAGDTLVVRPREGSIPTIDKGVRAGLLARYELGPGSEKVLFVREDSFKNYCLRGGAVYHALVIELIKSKVATQRRVILGAGCSDYSKGQTRVLAIDMTHPLVTGQPKFTVIEGGLRVKVSEDQEEAQESKS